jgi:hypothetical protein
MKDTLTFGVLGTDISTVPGYVACKTRRLLLRTLPLSDINAELRLCDPVALVGAADSRVITLSRVMSFLINLRFCSLI